MITSSVQQAPLGRTSLAAVAEGSADMANCLRGDLRFAFGVAYFWGAIKAG